MYVIRVFISCLMSIAILIFAVWAGRMADADEFDKLMEQVGQIDSSRAAARPSDVGAARGLSDAMIARRKRMIVRAAPADPYFNAKRKDPKYQYPIIACRLLVDPNDQQALDYIRYSLGYRGQDDDFSKSSLAGLFCRFGAGWPVDLVEVVRQEVTTYDGFLRGGTENHIAMRRTAGFLFGERFPDETFYYGLTGRQLAAECLRYMREYGRSLYGASMVEYLSPCYLAVNSAAWINVVEFAKEPNARLVARAILDRIFSDLAVNNLAGVIIPPLQREKGFLTDRYQLGYARSQSQWAAWMYFGLTSTPCTGETFPDSKFLPEFPHNLCADQHAVSRWNPQPVIRNIAAQRLAVPYRLWQSCGNWPCIEGASINPWGKPHPASAAHHLGACNPHYQMRSVYVARDYAMGAGYFREAMVDPLIRSAIPFGVVWRSTDDRNYLLAAHPFWFTQRTREGTDDKLGDEDLTGISPFCRVVHWENAAVVLYDIPETDPYHGAFGKGSPRFASERLAENIQSVFVYVPDTVDEQIHKAGAFFFREGNVYVGLRPLVENAHWEKSRRDGYVRLALPGALTGFAIEVGDRREYESFDEFQRRVAQTSLDLSDSTRQKRVTYCSSRGYTLTVEERATGWLPKASVNGVPLDFDRWPNTLSPYVACRDRVLDINDGRSGYTIDWRGELPVYTFHEPVSDQSGSGRPNLRN